MNCPFCGVITIVPHESEEACIEALNGEINRVRTLLHQVRPRIEPPLDAVDEKEQIHRVPPPA